MTDNDALHLVRNPWGRSEAEVREALMYLCDRFEQIKRERDEAEKVAASALEPTNEVLAKRDQAQRIAHLALDVEGWLFRTVDALTDEPDALPESVQSGVMGVYNDMHNARENRKRGGCPGPGKCPDPGCPAHYANGG